MNSIVRPGSALVALSTVIAMLLSVLVLPAHTQDDPPCGDALQGVFADVPPTEIHAANIDCIAAYGIAVGVGGGNYDPGGNVSRGQMASFLVNTVEVATNTPRPLPGGASPFGDIAGTTHETNIRIAADLRITSGRTPQSYEPAAVVTRAQMASFVVAMLGAVGVDVGPRAADGPAGAFTDIEGSIHRANIERLAAAGVVRGIGGGRYDPDGQVTRAQMATYLANSARLIAQEGLWSAPTLVADQPTAVFVSRVSHDEHGLAVRWDREVALEGDETSFTVTLESAEEVVATATTATQATTVTTLALAGELQADGMYWLEIGDEVVADANGQRNAAQRIAFIYSVVAEGAPGEDEAGNGDAAQDEADPDAPVGEDGQQADPPGDGEGDGDGDGDGQDGSSDDDTDESPTGDVAIESVVTDPLNDQLLVTFSEPVTCPTGEAAATAWFFFNSSILHGDDRAEDGPTRVSQSVEPSVNCALEYQDSGVGNGDFGSITYTQPTDPRLRVRSVGGSSLPTTQLVNVIDGLAPTLESVAGHAGSATLLVSFSEPIACASVGIQQLLVSIDLSVATVSDIGCSDVAASSLIVKLDAPVSAPQSVQVTVEEQTTLSDQSLDNRVASGSVETLITD